MRSVPQWPKYRALTRPLAAITMDNQVEYIPKGFLWDGSSVPFLFRGFFPRHRHPIASCRHDWRCLNAKNHNQRKWVDKQFRKDVRKTSWWITAFVAYIGVRIGAYLGIGNHF